MGEPTGQYFKFMSDIIDSGTWARLSSGARTLYPVLLKFSDQNFKKVWPSTSTLMKLTGFKNKRSIIDAKRDLVEAGLIHIIPGKGHKNTVYSFTFCYEREVHQYAPQRYQSTSLSGAENPPSADNRVLPQGIVSAAPNNINITIQNNQNQKENSDIKASYNDLEKRYPKDVWEIACQRASRLNLGTDLSIIEAFCKDLMSEFIKNTQNYAEISWKSFLSWAESNLTEKSQALLSRLTLAFFANEVVLSGIDSEFLETVIRKYYDEKYSKIRLKIVKEADVARSRLF